MREDSAIGVAFSASMALGALLIALRQHRTPGYVPSMDAFLFGSLMSVSMTDIVILSAVALLVAGVAVLLQKELLYYAFDPKLADVSGVRSGLLHYLFMLLLVLTVTVSARVVGIVLVSASLILPGTVALQVCRRLAPAMALATALGFVSFEGGIYLSYAWDVPPGATIVLLQFACFVASTLTARGEGLGARGER
jgi:ABC-type Mn2+/Zn2+ transport system permease subunit